MSELSVKSTRREIQGIFVMCLKSQNAPTFLRAASTFVKSTRRLLFYFI